MANRAQNLTRREFLGAAGAIGGGLAATALLGNGATVEAAAAERTSRKTSHLAWVWQFNDDGSPEEIRNVLAQNKLGVLLKTHDGQTWMGKWDNSPLAITGAHALENVTRYFEDGGVPVHAWCVVRGKDPMGEAHVCSEVLATGVRSLTFDLEPADEGHYWVGKPDDASRFGEELRRMRPEAKLAVAPDPRPWQLDAVPIGEFASFSDEILPQTYWNTFNNSPNYRLLRQRGIEPGPEGVTPELILDVTKNALDRYNRPIRPVGQGAADPASWQRFVNHAYSLGMESVSVWRYGTAKSDVWPLLRDMSPAEPAEAAAPAPAEPIVVEEASAKPSALQNRAAFETNAPGMRTWFQSMRRGLGFLGGMR